MALDQIESLDNRLFLFVFSRVESVGGDRRRRQVGQPEGRRDERPNSPRTHDVSLKKVSTTSNPGNKGSFDTEESGTNE